MIGFAYFPGIFIVGLVKLVRQAESGDAIGNVICRLLDLQGTSCSKVCS